jgi:hypothetical protein
MQKTCLYQECDRTKIHGHGYCVTHYRQKYVKKQELKKIKTHIHLSGQKCKLDFCDREATARGFCNTHWTQVFKYNMEPRPIGEKKICETPWCENEYRTGAGRRLCKICSNRISKYQISIDEFISLPNHCQICGSIKRLCIDHDHKTNMVRGILCSTCNTGIGMFKDNLNLVFIASKYLENNVSK